MPALCPLLPGARRVLLALGASVLLGGAALAAWPPILDLGAPWPAPLPAPQAVAEANRLFGTLRTVQVLLPASDVTDAAFLGRLRELDERLAALPGVASVVSPTRVDDVVADGVDGAVTAPLIDALPNDDAARAALRQRLRATAHVMGTLVAHDFRLASAVVTLRPQAPLAASAAAIAAVVAPAFPDYGLLGAPAVAWSLSGQRPAAGALWALAAALLLGLVAVGRHAAPPALALATASLAAVPAFAAMAAGGTRLTLVHGALLPIWAFLGSALCLGRLQAPAGATWGAALRAGRATAVATAIGMAVLAAPALGIAPSLRPLAGWAALGLAWQGLVAALAMPAAMSRWPAALAPRAGAPAATTEGPRPATAVLALTALAAAGVALSGLRVGDELPALLRRHGPLDRGAALAAAHLDTDTVVQVQVDADLAAPAALRALAAMADDLSLVHGVSGVSSIVDAVRLASVGLAGTARLPTTRAQAQALLALIRDDPAAAALMTADAQHALLHVRLRPVRPAHTLADLAAHVRADSGPFRLGRAEGRAARAVQALQLQNRLRSATRAAGIRWPDEAPRWGAAVRQLAWPAPADPAVATAALTAALSAEAGPFALSPAAAAAAARALVAMGPPGTPTATPWPASLASAAGADLADRAAWDAARAAAWAQAGADARAARARAQLAALGAPLPQVLDGALARAADDAASGQLALPAEDAAAEAEADAQTVTLTATLSGEALVVDALRTAGLAAFWHAAAAAAGAALAALALRAGSVTAGLRQTACCAGAPALAIGATAALIGPLGSMGLALVAGLVALPCLYLAFDAALAMMRGHAAAWAAPVLFCAALDMPCARQPALLLGGTALAALALIRHLLPVGAATRRAPEGGPAC